MENNNTVNLNEFWFRLVGLDYMAYKGDQKRKSVNNLVSFEISI